MGYDARARTMEVEFANGSVYRYAAVPGDVWTAFRRAESKGQFFQRFVREHYEGERVL